jgi:uncharacterized membrane protein YraQ (UPF0718 family)
MKSLIEEHKGKIYFLIFILFAYLILFFYNKSLFLKSLDNFWHLFKRLIFPLILVYFLMFLTNLLVTNKFITKHFQGSNIKKWFFVIVGGILSSGPIYMWYPLLAELRKKGLSYGLIACFLYNRAIKIPLLPVLIYYFGLKYVIVLTIVMIFASILQGLIVEKFLD